jgi:4-hydroxy-tetrahydrodipicolinate reductase
VTRVGVVGAAGRMGRAVCAAVADDPDLELVAAINPGRDGEPLGALIGRGDLDVTLRDDPDELVRAGATVAVDFTRPDAVLANVRWGIEHGLHLVVGTTGLTADDLVRIRMMLDDAGGGSNVVVAPNFAIGAVLVQRFAEEAARFFPAAEVIELHHDGKVDAPSGTAAATARRVAAARGQAWSGPTAESVPGVRGGDVDGVRVHSVRLPGLVAHQEVVFGGIGQTLTLRHDSTDRSSFMPGVLLAIRAVASRQGLTLGLEPLLGASAEGPQAELP